jgi:anaerobic magnesium-protoporphyrin IX monomethyl ester cyclase
MKKQISLDSSLYGIQNTPKILIITTPIRPVPTDYPPLGSLAIITALNKADFHDVEFYNIDYLRPKYKDVINYIKDSKPDILGISAVVSTAYEYSKNLSIDIKKVLPNTTILLGGNLGASAEIILKKTGVDFVCTGEGERTIVDFAECWKTAANKKDFENVKGVAFLDENDLKVTPFPDPIPAEEVYDIDWSILEDLDQMDFFVPSHDNSPIIKYTLSKDPRTYEPHRANKRSGNIVSSKGCVARCTFCHRWDKGIRYIPIPLIMERVDFLIQKYNVGFISFSDENFGSDRKWLALFTKEIKKRDLLFQVGGMRVDTITPEAIEQLKDAGCASIFYGMESGSQRILDVMEKKTTVEQNYNAVKWMAQSNLYTVVQIVIGMPGENSETIEETCQFTSYFVEQSPDIDPNQLSINFAQALPGTPLYELGRRKIDIGQSLDEEEEYLLKISDRDARDGETYHNFTDYPKLMLEKWHYEIQNKTRHAYIQKWGLDRYHQSIMKSNRYFKLKDALEDSSKKDTGYFADPARSMQKGLPNENTPKAPASSAATDSIHDSEEDFNFERGQKIPSLWFLVKQKHIGAIATFYPNFFYKMRGASMIFVFLNCIRKTSIRYAFKLLAEYIRWRITSLPLMKQDHFDPDFLSLRKLIRRKMIPDIESDNPSMAILRKGR